MGWSFCSFRRILLRWVGVANVPNYTHSWFFTSILGILIKEHEEDDQ